MLYRANTTPATAPRVEVVCIDGLDTKGLVASFLSSQDVKASSRDQYQRTLRQFFTWLEVKGYSLNEIAREHLLQYKEELLASGKSSLTVGSYITSVRRFYEWAEANRYAPNVAKGIRSPKRQRAYRKEVLSPAQSTSLLDSQQNEFNAKALRDYAIVSLLLRTGLRTVEVTRANVGDIVWINGQRVLKVQGKGRDEKDQLVVLTDKAYQPIAAYLVTRIKATAQEPLFTSTSNNNTSGRLTTRTVSGMVKAGLRSIGLNERTFTAHSLRHTAVVSVRRAGGTLEQAQAMARHASPATTQIYDEIFRQEQRLENSGEALIDSLY
jgi:integrase/recombinase XerD